MSSGPGPRASDPHSYRQVRAVALQGPMLQTDVMRLTNVSSKDVSTSFLHNAGTETTQQGESDPYVEEACLGGLTPSSVVVVAQLRHDCNELSG